MKNYKPILYVLLTSFLNDTVLNIQDFGPQPRIISSAGHLIFNSAENKNIHFITKGKGKIMLNEGDLTDAATLARNASETLSRINSEYYDTYFQVQRFKRLLDGHHGILNRLTLLETGFGPRSNMSIPGTPGRQYNDFSLSVINRRLGNLQRKVNRLMLLLTRNECANNPCKNGGTCQDLFNAYICQCPSEWEGPDCDKDVNECARFAGTDLGCQNGATCVNKPGSYECLCAHGWFGLHCTRQTTSCASGSVAELCGHGTCIPQNNGPGYKCLCDQGWTTEGTNLACTKDVDECTLSKPPCSTNPPVTCVNVPGSFYCGSCPQGYTGNGYYCTDLDECAVFNGGCSVNPMVRCINTPGSRMCGMCPPGYVGDGISCSFQGVCGVNNGGCHHFAQCRDNPRISSTFVECICPAGYVGSGIGPNGCVRISDGVDPCASNPCLHGTCVTNNITGTYICQCTRRYTGKNCDIRKDPCQPNPCANGGTCRSIADISYRCICTTAYTGDTCDKERQACGGQLRGNSGTLKYPATHSTVYAHQISCAWIIQTNATKVLNITFTEFHLEGSHNCRFDWLQIHDGRNSAAHSLGRFCGNSFPNGGTIISTHNVLYLWFRSDPSVASSGFELNWASIEPVCGGTYSVTSHGSIRSPGFPGSYPPNRDCYWTLEAPPGKRLQFHFFSLMIGNNPNCSYDYLSIHQGYLTSDRVLAKYCNTSHPEPLYSAGPEVLIHFHSDSVNSYPGFQIAYSVVEGIPGCGGVYTANEGEISSPSVDGVYPPDLICEYKIQVLEKSRIKLTFLSFALEEDDNCFYDSVEIHEGSSADSSSIGKYCGFRVPPPYLSVGNQVFIVFNSDWGNNEAGFRLKYETVCGGTYSEPSGTIESPGYPNPYMEDQICIYEIIQPLGTSISLEFVDFDMESTSYPDCIFDFVEVRDGDNENSTFIGQYCAEPPPAVQSSYNYLWIKFESDSSVSARGFRANYTTINTGCGGILKTDAGVVKSPEHPDSYPAGLTCTWIVVAPPGNVIQLSWLLFQLEQSSTCSFDYVEVYSNHTKNELMGKYCGTMLPPTLISSSNMITIKFISDSSINFDGFMASYTFVDEQSACGGRYFTSSGTLKSPFYPNEYPENRECTWVITVNHGQQIMLNISDFALESFSNCNYDYLEIRNGGTASSPLIGKYCGTKIPKQIPSHASQLYLFFKSDMSYTDRGFKITWDSTTTGCGGSLTSPKGSIISPFYPEPYNQNAECYWRISVSAGSVIQLVFADLDLEGHVNCGMDYVEIFDGPNTAAKSLGKFCFTVNVPFIRSTSNHVTVKFRSDGSFQLRGFHIQYTTVCHNTLKGFRGIIESPNFPYGYPQDQDCSWKIEVATGNKINITFSHFELERSEISTAKNCSFDFVEIKYAEVYNDYRENEESMTKYGSYCGSTIPPVMTINSNIAEVHFVSDNLMIGSGFRLEWQIEGCGGILTHPTGSFATPNYPNGYPQGTQCNWLIQLDYGTSIEITFTDIDFEASVNCNYDFILVTNGPDDTYPQLTRICSKGTKPVVITTTGNTAFVRFESDYSYHGKGFWANYTSVATKCGGKLTAPLGSFHSPNYPKNYDKLDVCEWQIEIEDNHVIELTFEDVDLAGDCHTDYIKVYDGPSMEYPVLVTVCGNSKPNTTFRSTYNQMVIEMRTSEQYTAKGFLAKYSMGCGARITTQSSGIISLSDQTLASTSLINCSWTIINADPSQHVSLTITHMDSLECYYEDYGVKIYNGENDNSPLMATYCENKLPPTLTSDGNALHIELNYPAMNFIAKYSTLDTTCGGVLTGAAGSFATPRYPSTYPVDIQCEWTIQVAPGNKIELSFSLFELVSSDNCNLDYLEIRADNSRGKLLGTFCDTQPTNITQVGNLWLLFRSAHAAGDNSGATAKGFLAEYSLVHGIDLTGSSGRIGSPLYPNYYIQSGEFTWRITVTFGKAISITFIDFYIESYAESDCFLTNIEFFDGFDEEAPSLKQLCGINTPEPIKSTSNVVYIKMNYDSVRHGSRFLLDWLEVDSTISLPTLPKPKVEGCGSEDIIDMSTINIYNLTSPGYPNGYMENLECEWIFSTLPEYHLSIDFFKVDIENIMGQCLLDTVTIYTGKSGAQDWVLVDTICFPNATQNSEIHTSNLMKVVFRTDGYMNGTGFQARVRKECGGSIKGTNGIIAKNDSELRYEDTCEWNITVRSGRTIEVKFLKLDIASGKVDSCDSYIMLKNGHYPDSPILGAGKYCDNTIPEPLHTTGNYLYIKYQGYPKKSFQLSYEEMSQGCGGTLTLSKIENETYISSPNYPNIPPPYTECFWTFIAPPGESIRIDFEERFDVTRSSGCELAGVELRDGGSKYSPLLGKFCDEIPNSTFSSDNMLHVRFFTNVEDPRNGFKALVSLATCGGVIRSQAGEIHSPSFNIKKLYPRNSNCIWHIIGPHDHYLILNFNTLDLEPSTTDCTSVDHVSLSERFKLNDTLINIGDYCGNKKPGEITTSSNEVIVNLITGNSENMFAGFSLSFNASQEACGGNLNAESGIIESPGYPVSNHNNRECEWIITVPEGRRITVEFIDLDVDVSEYDQGIAFFNDENYRSHIKYVSELNSSEPIKSSSNTMLVLFWSSHAFSYRGFQARYSSDEPTICRGSFNQNSGIIRHVNESSYYCMWKRNSGSVTSQTVSMSVMVNFAEPTPEPHTCNYAPASVLITTEKEQEFLGQFCRSLKHPTIIRSPHPTTKIIGYQDKRRSTLEFTIDYKTHPCGGIIISQDGYITSPGFPNKFSQTVECAWLLKLPENQRIKLTPVNINLDSNCEYNYLVLYNGELPTSPKIGHFCQNNKPSVITSQSNTFLIEYHADERSSGTGFKLHYEFVAGGCGGVFHDSTQLIETPSYPSDYANNAECEWQIIAQNGYHLSLEFIDRFYIEQSDKCAHDFIEVWDYKNDTWKSLGKKCGRETPQNLNSTSNKMKILFRSNDKIKATGFKARWTLHCGGVFEADGTTRYIVSPGYPNEYNNSLVCEYKIMAPKAYINIVFEDFILEQDSSCKYDNVSIQTVVVAGMYIPNIGTPKTYCGTRKPPPIRQRDGVIIKFATDSWITRRGFKLSYSTDSCGGIITEPTAISSPMSTITSNVYASAVSCVWNITAPQDKNIVIRFTSFELEHNLYCSYDSVAIFDGLTTNETSRLALLCGNLSNHLPVIKSRGNSMTVYLKTDYTNHFAGFKAIVYFNYGPSAGCGGVINVDDSKTLEAPSGLSNLDCHWEIITKKDSVLKIRFAELHLTPCSSNRVVGFGSKNCTCNLVEIRDGSGSFSELIDQLCDNTIPQEYTTSGHTAWIRLYTVETTRDKPFKVTFLKSSSLCGPSVLNVTNQTEVLTSPLYPNPYPNNIKCTWFLQSTEFLDKFDLRFTDFDLTEVTDSDFRSRKCGSDRVEIADKVNSKVITEGLGTATVFSGTKSTPVYGGHRMPVGIHQFCGIHSLSFDHYSGQNEVVVSFYSGMSNQHGKGFRMEYQLAGCNRNFTSVQGRLMNSQIKGDCIIIITAPENYTISLHFMTFILYDQGNCEAAGFEVHDGVTRADQQLAKLCGYNVPNSIFSTRNKLWIHVWNNNQNSVAFYDAVYTSSPEGKGCGGTFYNYAGKFTSPLHPNSFRENNVCTWEITVPQNLRVALKFTVFDVNGACSTDYIVVTTYNRDETVSTEHRFCKGDNPAVLQSENNHIVVKYTTTVNNGGTGWIAQFLGVTSDSKLEWHY